MSKPAAIFDVDGTLVRGGTERLFLRYLVQTGRLSPRRAFTFLLRLAAAPRNRFSNKTYLSGLAAAETEGLARRCCQEMIRPRLRPRAAACLKAHQARGRQIVLLTGSLGFLVVPLKEHLAADWLLATEVNQAHGRFTGEICGLHPRGDNKRVLLEDLARRQGLDLSSSFAYGDHVEDIPMLGCVGQPAAVNPTRALLRVARERGWPVVDF